MKIIILIAVITYLILWVACMFFIKWLEKK